jgi:uncharacterized membrane protein
MSPEPERKPTPARAESGPSRWGRPAPLWLALLLGAAGVGAAYLLKVQCAIHPWASNFQNTHLCYNDIQPLYHVRGLDRGLLPYRDVSFEYPVVTGTFMYLMARLLHLMAHARILFTSETDPNYFQLTAMFMAPLAISVAVALRRHVRSGRLAFAAAGPPMILHAFLNWDLLAVAPAAWGLAAMERRSDRAAGAAFGLGFSAKLFPIFFLPATLLARWSEGDRSGARRMLLWFAAAALACNLPWIIVAPKGWWGIWTFHAHRYPDFDTLWYWLAHHMAVLAPSSFWSVGSPSYTTFVNLVSLAVFGGLSVWFLRRGWTRRSEPDGYPWAQVGLGILCVFLLSNKIYSPQYTLWLVPLAAMCGVPWTILAAFAGADVAVYVARFNFFVVMNTPASGWQGLFEAAVLARAVALAMIAAACAGAARLRPEPLE